MGPSRKTTAATLAAGLVLVSLLGCPGPGSPPDKPTGAILILLDTTRADHLSAYGYGRATSPALVDLAARGALFEQTVSFAPWTLPSVVSLLSGEAAPRAFDGKLTHSLISTLAAAGWRTAAITEGGYVSREYGLDLGFDEFIEEEGAVQLLDPGETRDRGARGGIENTFRLAREWIERHGGERFFLLIHTYEPHTPYTRRDWTAGLSPGRVGEIFPVEKVEALQSGRLSFDENDLAYLEALYDGGITEADRHVGELLEFLEDQGLADSTLTVVTSDHGEELGSHYPVRAGDHGHALLDDQLLIPLIVHDPTRRFEVSRIPAQVRSFDILPTIVELLGLEAAPVTQGRSLLPFLEGRESRGRAAYGGVVDAGPGRSFVRHLGYKLIRLHGDDADLDGNTIPALQLYDLQSDPGEQQNRADAEPQMVERLLDLLGRLETGQPVDDLFELPDDADEKLIERLRSLGYVR